MSSISDFFGVSLPFLAVGFAIGVFIGGELNRFDNNTCMNKIENSIDINTEIDKDIIESKIDACKLLFTEDE